MTVEIEQLPAAVVWYADGTRAVIYRWPSERGAAQPITRPAEVEDYPAPTHDTNAHTRAARLAPLRPELETTGGGAHRTVWRKRDGTIVRAGDIVWLDTGEQVVACAFDPPHPRQARRPLIPRRLLAAVRAWATRGGASDAR